MKHTNKKLNIKVEIKKAGKKSYWYANKIGQIFEIDYSNEYGYHVKCDNQSYYVGQYISKRDCKIIKEDKPKHTKIAARWRCNTPQLLKEIQLLSFNGGGIMRIPLQGFAFILSEVADRAVQLNDPILNGLMCRLALYESADQNQRDKYDKKLTEQTIYKSLVLQSKIKSKKKS